MTTMINNEEQKKQKLRTQIQTMTKQLKTEGAVTVPIYEFNNRNFTLEDWWGAYCEAMANFEAKQAKPDDQTTLSR